jgi:hypothetical protein
MNSYLQYSRHKLPLICAIVIVFILLFSYIRLFHPPPDELWTAKLPAKAPGTTAYSNKVAATKNLQLSESQCTLVFPELFVEIDRATKHWDRVTGTKQGVTLKDLDDVEPKNGYVRAMVYDGSLYIIAVRGEVYRRHYATLAAIHRALITTPSYTDDPIPNIEFTFNVDDVAPAGLPQWTYARKVDELDSWLMPDFGFWSWPETKVGSYDEVQQKAIAMEHGIKGSMSIKSDKIATNGPYDWKHKVSKVMWRGATMGLEVRERLINVTKNKSWADVKELNWHDTESMTHDLKSMAQHCQYRYLVHTEGNSYSGRLKYLQNCESVLIAHKLVWVQHTQHLMKSYGPDQNFVEVARDFSDLESTMKELQRDEKKAKRIAENSRKIFRDRYLSPAAETCYWRQLMREWANVQTFDPEFWGIRTENGTVEHLSDNVEGERVWRGVPWESYILMRQLEWDPQ